MLKNKKMFSIIMAIMLVMTMTVSVYAWRADYVTSSDNIQFESLGASANGGLYMDTSDEYYASADTNISYSGPYLVSVSVSIVPYNTQAFETESDSASHTSYVQVNAGPVHQINASSASGSHSATLYLDNATTCVWSEGTSWSKGGN